MEVLVIPENAALVDRISKVLGVPPDELVRKGLEDFLKSQLRICLAEIGEVKAKYSIKSAAGLEKKIKDGAIEDHPAWEDLILLENLEDRAQKIKDELVTFKK